MNPATRAMIFGAILLATIIPALPTTTGATCYRENDDDNFACCELGARVPIVVGDDTYYLDVRRPYDASIGADRGDPANSTASFTPHATTGAVWLYLESNGQDDLQRGGSSDLGAASRWDHCYDDIYGVEDTVLF